MKTTFAILITFKFPDIQCTMFEVNSLINESNMLIGAFQDAAQSLYSTLSSGSYIYIPKCKEAFDIFKPTFLDLKDTVTSNVGGLNKIGVRPILCLGPNLCINSIPFLGVSLCLFLPIANKGLSFLGNLKTKNILDVLWNNQYINSMVNNFQRHFIVNPVYNIVQPFELQYYLNQPLVVLLHRHLLPHVRQIFLRLVATYTHLRNVGHISPEWINMRLLLLLYKLNNTRSPINLVDLLVIYVLLSNNRHLYPHIIISWSNINLFFTRGVFNPRNRVALIRALQGLANTRMGHFTEQEIHDMCVRQIQINEDNIYNWFIFANLYLNN